MAESLTFLMGKYEVVLPIDLRYAVKNHMWCQAAGDRLRFGFTSFAVRLMKDVYFLDWSVNVGDPVRHLQEIGHIETSKAESDLFAPVSGTVADFNQELLKDPSAINVDNYGAGWLFDVAPDPVAPGPLLSVTEYHQFLADNWEKIQRQLKGQVTRES
jgi:glycine cleavage system H protein